jgi:hypothetical protein
VRLSILLALLVPQACAPSIIQDACLSDQVHAWFDDDDQDGFGDPTTASWDHCPTHPTKIANEQDCNDHNRHIHPDAQESWYDGIDQDCSGTSDFDQDGDQHERGPDDCNDLDPLTFLGAPEIWYDDIDQGCDGGNDHDQDGDGYPAASDNGDDCDDTNPATYPDAPEAPTGADNDCNGVLDDVTLLKTTRLDFMRGALDGATVPAIDGDGALSNAPIGDALATPRWLEPMPIAMSSVGIVATHDALYIAGGASGAGSSGGETLVARALIRPDGRLEPWIFDVPLPAPSAAHTMVTDGHCLVVVAGSSPATGSAGRTITAILNDDGSLEPWVDQAPYPLAVSVSRGVLMRGWVHVTGGSLDGTSLASVYRGRLDPDCTIDAWLPEASLPVPMSYHTAVTAGDQLYVTGGLTQSVFRALPNANGGITSWISDTSMPTAVWAGGGAIVGGHLVITGGDIDGAMSSLIHLAPLQPDGTLGPWQVIEDALPEPRRLQTATQWNGRGYIVGGWTEVGNVSVTRSDEVALLELSGPVSPTYQPKAVYQARFDLTQERGLVQLDWNLSGAADASVLWHIRTADATGNATLWSPLASVPPINLVPTARYVELVAELESPSGARVVLEQVQLSHR